MCAVVESRCRHDMMMMLVLKLRKNAVKCCVKFINVLRVNMYSGLS